MFIYLYVLCIFIYIYKYILYMYINCLKLRPLNMIKRTKKKIIKSRLKGIKILLKKQKRNSKSMVTSDIRISQKIKNKNESRIEKE